MLAPFAHNNYRVEFEVSASHIHNNNNNNRKLNRNAFDDIQHRKASFIYFISSSIHKHNHPLTHL